MTSPWVDGEPLNAATMYARTTARIDAIPQFGAVQITAPNSAFTISPGSTRAMFAANMYTTLYVTGTALAPSAINQGNGGKITVQVSGLYRWSASVGWPTGTSTRGVVLLYRNGAGVASPDLGVVDTLLTTSSLREPAGDMFYATAGDVLNLAIGQTGSSNVTIALASFGIEFVGPC